MDGNRASYFAFELSWMQLLLHLSGSGRRHPSLSYHNNKIIVFTMKVTMCVFMARIYL